MFRVNAMSMLQPLLAVLVIRLVAGKSQSTNKSLPDASNIFGCKGNKSKLDGIVDDINRRLGVSNGTSFNLTLPKSYNGSEEIFTTTTAPDPCHPSFNCQMKSDWLDSWSTEQILWCCKHKGKGCFENPRAQQERESKAWKAKLRLKKLAGRDTKLLNELKATNEFEKSLDARKETALKQRASSNRVAKKQAEMMANAVKDSRNIKPHDAASLFSEFSSRLKSVETQKGSIEKKLGKVKQREESVDKLQRNATTSLDELKGQQKGLRETKGGIKERDGKLYVKKVAFNEIINHQKSLLAIERRTTKRANQELSDAVAALQTLKKHHGAQHSLVSKRANAFASLKKKVKTQNKVFMQHDASLKEYISTERHKLQRRKQSVLSTENGITQEELRLDEELANLNVKQASFKKKVAKFVNASPNSSNQTVLASMFDHIITAGTKLVVTKTTPIWSAADKFTTIGKLRRGDEVVATDVPSIVPKSHLHVAVPIKPKGFVRLDVLIKKSMLVKTGYEHMTALQRTQHESGIMSGTPLVISMASPIWQSTSRSVLIGNKKEMAKATATGPPVSSKHGSTLMVPVKPRGFINLANIAVDHATLRKKKNKKDATRKFAS